MKSKGSFQKVNAKGVVVWDYSVKLCLCDHFTIQHWRIYKEMFLHLPTYENLPFASLHRSTDLLVGLDKRVTWCRDGSTLRSYAIAWRWPGPCCSEMFSPLGSLTEFCSTAASGYHDDDDGAVSDLSFRLLPSRQIHPTLSSLCFLNDHQHF